MGTEKGSARGDAPPPRARASLFAACYMKTTGDESGNVKHLALINSRDELVSHAGGRGGG